MKQQMQRWRLILGQETEDDFKNMGMNELSNEQTLMDNALSAIYGLNDFDYDDMESTGGKSTAGKGKSRPKISKWLGDVRSLFDSEMVTVIQNDAVERKGLKQLLLEPELLDEIEPSIDMASTLLMLKDQIPKSSKESARRFIQKIVEDINKRLKSKIERAVTSSINKRVHSPIPSASAIDFKYTISRNLKNYNLELKKIIPEKVYFFDRQIKLNKYNIILDIDQSGSMGESIIYSSIMACILATMSSINTHVVAFDTQIMDLTPLCADPVDLLFGFQMGGGTDIAGSIAYCRKYIENPSKTIFFLITDLDEGGNRAALLNHLRDMKESGVTVIVLLAVSDNGGAPYYNNDNAKKIASMKIPCFACSPEKLPDLLERALKKQDLSCFENKDK